MNRSLLVVALIAAACSDSVSLEQPDRGVPASVAEAAASSVALWGFNGTMPQNGTALIKEFNPANPPLGSTIVATFAWRGSTNIITSVTDYLWTGQQVGNTYHLVEYTTAGGFSMATYVATNAQNYPVPKRVLGEELVVQATLATAVSAGGVLVSAFTGVNPAFAQAVGPHRSATGSGSTFTPARPGAIALAPGALAYGVSLSSAGLVGMDPPAGFTKLTTLSDASFQFDAEHATLANGGSVDPTWTWSFNSPSTWLASVLALNPVGGTASGGLTATTSTWGASHDPDGYTVTLDQIDERSIATSGSVTFTDLAPGSHTVVLAGVAANCTVSGPTSRTVTVPSGGTVTAAFSVSCTAAPGELAVTVATSGSSLDPDGYTVTVDESNSQSVATNGTATFASVSSGTHSITLSGIAVTCSVSGPNPRDVTVPSGGNASTTFSVTCAAPSGSLTVTTSTSGSGLDPDGYTATVDGSQSRAIAINGSVTFSNLAAGSHGVVLSGVAGNCTVSGGASRTVNVPAGGAGSTSYAVSCASTGGSRIVIDQRNGTLNATGTAILKGFNPTNPHHGAAIIASFFWVGSSNIITSVSDHLTDGTPVGNPYTLVEYVTAGGISMATYVATNVQNFPDPNPNQDKVLVVQANLSAPITEGGIMISAYGGVHAVAAQALGAHRAATGSGSSITAVRPGPITAGPGALTYGVILSNGVAGIEPPAGFTNVTTISDAAVEADGEYSVGGGTVDPQWTWYFNSPSTWLGTVLALNPAP